MALNIPYLRSPIDADADAMRSPADSLTQSRNRNRAARSPLTLGGAPPMHIAGESGGYSGDVGGPSNNQVLGRNVRVNPATPAGGAYVPPGMERAVNISNPQDFIRGLGRDASGRPMARAGYTRGLGWNYVAAPENRTIDEVKQMMLERREGDSRDTPDRLWFKGDVMHGTATGPTTSQLRLDRAELIRALQEGGDAAALGQDPRLLVAARAKMARDADLERRRAAVVANARARAQARAPMSPQQMLAMRNPQYAMQMAELQARQEAAGNDLALRRAQLTAETAARQAEIDARLKESQNELDAATAAAKAEQQFAVSPEATAAGFVERGLDSGAIDPNDAVDRYRNWRDELQGGSASAATPGSTTTTMLDIVKKYPELQNMTAKQAALTLETLVTAGKLSAAEADAAFKMIHQGMWGWRTREYPAGALGGKFWWDTGKGWYDQLSPYATTNEQLENAGL